MSTFFLAIDQGTTSSRAIIFDQDFHIISVSQQEFQQYFPQSGWVEHDAEEIWMSVLAVCRDALKKAHLDASQITAIGISNQRETTVLWDKTTGKPVSHAIVWQDRRTAGFCDSLKQQGYEALVQEKTGLLLDPYFSATKIRWILENNADLRAQVTAGNLAFGTIESFLVWKLTGGKTHVTDISNASRTLLMNLRTQQWDDELLKLFEVPQNLLPKIVPNAMHYGDTEVSLFGHAIAICGMAGDQQAALIGQACIKPGMLKATLGTGAFLVLNTGEKLIRSTHQLLSTIAYAIGDKVYYALEGSIFNAGTIVKWLRDGLQLIQNASETEALARSLNGNDGVYLVPAFTGLGAPYWRADVRGSLVGLTRGTSKAHFARAALEAIAYQLKDICDAMQRDVDRPLAEMRVDGGLSANHWLLQFIADMLNTPVLLTSSPEASALGVAMLAAIGSHHYQTLAEVSQHWHASHKFLPTMTQARRDDNYQQWVDAVQHLCQRG